jgi:hypothetical protein
MAATPIFLELARQSSTRPFSGRDPQLLYGSLS